ncbi:hypothetical protein LCGC14_1023530 [marine sediment metagenome]|uniref:Capsid protein n=1 Tax=marine sediment metagenome TaxID=412755 RepID=A0A0F9MWR8_9ZZZZ
MSDWATSRIPDDIASGTGYGIPEIYSARVIDHVRSNLVCVGAVDTTWREQLAVGNKVWIPVLTTQTASVVDVTVDWGGTSNSHMGTDTFGTVASITVDKWYESPVQLSDGEDLQTQIPNLLGKMASNAGYQIAKVIDEEVNDLFASLTTTWRGSDGQTFSDDILIDLMEGLDEAEVPRTDRSLIIDPSVLADMYKMDKFVNKDYNQTLTGEIGRTPYGDRILMSNNLNAQSTGNDCALIHREAIGAVIQMPPKVEKFRYASRHSDVINTSAIFGADILRATFGATFYSRKL